MAFSRKFQKPEWKYLPDEGLLAAIEVARELEMPLLLTGEPGTGKTQLAYHIGREEKLEVLRYNTKTTSTAKDLLYTYDALSHFREAQRNDGTPLSTMDYLAFTALGKAIVDSAQKRYVVLVDEIDKAPRDFPNDVLFEFETLSFRIEEAKAAEVQVWAEQKEQEVLVDNEGTIGIAKQENAPLLILTSNSEKNLPDAFLRRCVYYHIPFPKGDRLKEIVQANISLSADFTDRMFTEALRHFNDIRDNKGLRKKPATAELLAWVHLLQKDVIDVSTNIPDQLIKTYPALVKNKEDLLRLVADAQK